MKQSPHIAPIDSIKVHPSKIIKFASIQESRPRNRKEIENEKNLTRGKFNGYLSYKSKKQITERLEVWLNGINEWRKSKNRKKLKYNPYITFITLTLPSKQMHTDNEIKRKCLNSFIIYLREQCGVENYYWRAEPQKNGNIHFHILADKFVNHKEINKRWNTIINLLNYVDIYSTKFNSITYEKYKEIRAEHYKKDKKRVKKAWENGKSCNWTSPNSTDVHSLKSIRNITAYITKYMTKGDENRVIKGRLTGCSDSLRDYKQHIFHCDKRIWNELFSLSRNKEIKGAEGDYFKVFYFNKKQPMHKVSPYLFALMLESNRSQIERTYAIENDSNSSLIMSKEKEKGLTKGEIKEIEKVVNFNEKNPKKHVIKDKQLNIFGWNMGI